MSSISNRFFVTTIDDGTTLHGNLSVIGSLTQAWNGIAATPDWTVAANQPTIYLTLLNGNTLVQPVSNSIRWLYNGVEITFDASTNISTSPVGLFQKTTQNVSYGGTILAMPALKIIGNLAGYGGNVDMDTITLRGTYSVDSSNIDFSATTQVRISSINASGYLGVINFVDGISDITEGGQTLTMYAKLYGGDNCVEVSTFTTRWYLNADTVGTAGSKKTVDGTSYKNAYQVSEDDVVDHATVRCEFSIGNDVKYTAYVGIDDMQDPEFMYIQYNGANGNAASLHQGDSAAFTIWVGTRDDASVLGGTSSPTFPYIDVRLLDGDAAVITGSVSGLPSDAGNGYRPLSMSGGKGVITIPYDVAKNQGKKNLTGVVYAYTSNPRP